MRGEHFASQLLWATVLLLVTRVSLIYLVDEFFVFSFLVLLKEMRTHGESKISSCCFYVWCKSSSSGKITNGFNTLIISTEKFHCRCSTGLQMCLRLKILLMCQCGVWVDCKCMEFVAAAKQLRLDQAIKNLTCGDSTGRNRIEKDWVGVPPGLVWGNRGGRVV